VLAQLLKAPNFAWIGHLQGIATQSRPRGARLKIDKTAVGFICLQGMNVFAYISVAGLAVATTLCLMAPAADAHSRRQASNAPASGISFPNLPHGQLKVMARYRPAVLDLANRQISPDLQTRTLQNYVNLQYAYCLWGLIPGSITNESSAFNACSHAYLAASKALLDHLQKAADNRTEAGDLLSKINTAMIADATAFAMCSNGIAPLNTAEIIMPEWADVSFNPLTGLAWTVAFAAIAGAAAMTRSGRKREDAPPRR